MADRESHRFLMPLWEGGGNVPPELGVARRLVARGHQVHVLGDPTIEARRRRRAARSRRGGAPRTGPRSTPPRTPSRTGRRRTRWSCCVGRATASSPGRRPNSPPTPPTRSTPSGPTSSCPTPSFSGRSSPPRRHRCRWRCSCRTSGSCRPRGTPPIGPGLRARQDRARPHVATRCCVATVNRLFRAGLPPLNAARGARGLAPLSSFYDQALRAERILVLTSPAFDYAASAVPANVRYVGPILDDPDWVAAVDVAVGRRRRAPARAGRLQLHLPEPRRRSCGGSSRRCRPCRCVPS